MANFLRTTGIIHEIEELIVNAKVKLIILSPYIRMADIIIERLKGKENKNIEIIFVYGKKELNTNELKKIKSLSNIQLFFNKNLHGKFYANEDNAIITSMNLYEFSERNNREFGISVNKKIDSKIFQESMEEVDSIIKNATLVFTNKIANTNNEIIKPTINFDFLQYLY